MYDRLFLLSQSTMPALNALLLGPLLYRSRLVPKVLPMVGMIGAPLLLAVNLAVLFGVVGRSSSLALLLAVPIALWELSLGFYLAVRGFRPDAVGRLLAFREPSVEPDSAMHPLSRRPRSKEQR
jgi:hypothetical protein